MKNELLNALLRISMNGPPTNIMPEAEHLIRIVIE